jgi:lipopolysaccharide export system protein LptA
LEPGTIAHTNELSYEPNTGLIYSPVKTSLSRTGEMSGTAGKMQYFVNTGLMRLTDNFDIRLDRGGGIRGGASVFQYKENWVTVADGVEVTSTNGKIHGGSGRSELLPGTYHPKKVTVENSAGVDAPSFTVDSDWLESELSDTGTIEHVLARGNVSAERKSVRDDRRGNSSNEDSLNGTLTGPEVEAWLDAGILKLVEARQHPRFEMGGSGTLNASEKIRIEPSGAKTGALRTEGVSKFERDGLTVDGRNFVIDMRDEVHEQIFNTAARATLKTAGLETTADTTMARFDTSTRTLTRMDQSGTVTFKEEKGGRTGSSGKLTVLDGGDRIEMEGGTPTVMDAQGTLYSRRITLDRNRESFTGNENVRMVTAGSNGKPVVIQGNHVEGQGNGEHARLDYTGKVQMYSPDGTRIQADHLTVFPNDKRFVAEGKARSDAPQQRVITAQRLEFTDSGDGRQRAHYTGDVSVSGYFDAPGNAGQKTQKSALLDLKSRDLDVQSRNGDLDRILANGGVAFTQGLRKGHGERLEYNITTGETLLLGTDASDAEISEGTTLLKGCSIQIFADGGRTATACSDRSVISSFKPKN